MHTRTRLAGILLLMLGLFLLASCADTTITVIDGSGNVVTETRELASFMRVNLLAYGDVFVEPGDNDAVTIEIEDNFIPYLEIDVRDNELRIGRQNNTELRHTKPVIFHVTYSGTLKGLNITGSGTITWSGETNNFTARINGSGTMNLAGTGDEFNVELNGAGIINAGDFVTNNVTVDLNGMGEIVVNCTNSLDAEINGMGTIHYVGSPQIKQTIEGAGRVLPISSDTT